MRIESGTVFFIYHFEVFRNDKGVDYIKNLSKTYGRYDITLSCGCSVWDNSRNSIYNVLQFMQVKDVIFTLSCMKCARNK